MRMQWSNTWTVLVVMLLLLVMLLLYRLEYRHSSDEEMEKRLSALCEQYALLQQQHASAEQWRAFADKAAGTTAPIVADIEATPSFGQGGTRVLYDLARYTLPEAVAGKGQFPARTLRQALDKAKEQRERQDGYVSESAGDPLLVATFVINALVVLYLGYLLLPTLKSWLRRRASDSEEVLRQLSGKIENDPTSARYRGLRARLCTKLGRYAEAAADLDWILQNSPQGADVEEWRHLRATVRQKQAVTS